MLLVKQIFVILLGLDLQHSLSVIVSFAVGQAFKVVLFKQGKFPTLG